MIEKRHAVRATDSLSTQVTPGDRIVCKNYTKKTNRSRRKPHKLIDDAFQMVLLMNELVAEVADAIEETAPQAGLMMKAMIDDAGSPWLI